MLILLMFSICYHMVSSILILFLIFHIEKFTVSLIFACIHTWIVFFVLCHSSPPLLYRYHTQHISYILFACLSVA